MQKFFCTRDNKSSLDISLFDILTLALLYVVRIDRSNSCRTLATKEWPQQEIVYLFILESGMTSHALMPLRHCGL